MIWFYGFQIAGLFFILLMLYIYTRYRYLRYFHFLWKHKKRIAIAALTVFIIITLICGKQLYRTLDCYFLSNTHKATTKYSWYTKTCQIKRMDGSYFPIKSARVFSGEKDGDESGDE